MDELIRLYDCPKCGAGTDTDHKPDHEGIPTEIEFCPQCDWDSREFE